MGLSTSQIGILRPVANEQYGPAKASLTSGSRDFKSALVEATSNGRSERGQAEKAIEKRNKTNNPSEESDSSLQSTKEDGTPVSGKPRPEDDAGDAAEAAVVIAAINPIQADVQPVEVQGDATTDAAAINSDASRVADGESREWAPTAAATQTAPVDHPVQAAGVETASGDEASETAGAIAPIDSKLRAAIQAATNGNQGEEAGSISLNSGDLVADGDQSPESLETTNNRNRTVNDSKPAEPASESSTERPAAGVTSSQEEGDAEVRGGNENDRQVSRRELREVAQESRSDTRSIGESAFEEKVRRWIDGRREGGIEVTKAASTGSRIVKPAALAARGEPKQAPVARGESRTDAAVRGAAALKITGGKGDGAAAAVSRLLVEDGGGRQAESRTESAPVAHSAHASASSDSRSVTSSTSSTTPAPAGPAGVVAELLAARHDGADSVANAARALNASGGLGRYQATMKLDPPEMGQLSVQVRMNQQTMTLHVRTENESVSRLIESRLSDLRDALAAHGIRVDKTEVVTRSPDAGETNLGRERSQGDARHPSSESSREGAHGSWTDNRGWNGSNGGGASDEGGRPWYGDAEPWAGEAEPAGIAERMSLIGDRSVDLTA